MQLRMEMLNQGKIPAVEINSVFLKEDTLFFIFCIQMFFDLILFDAGYIFTVIMKII